MGQELTRDRVLGVIAQLCRERKKFQENEIQYAAWDLDDDMLGTLSLANLIVIRMGYRPLEIFSGRRTCAEQRRLRYQGHDAARQSLHTVGRAIDAQGEYEDVVAFRYVWGLLGGRNGVDFRTPSPNHYDLPLPLRTLPDPCW